MISPLLPRERQDFGIKQHFRRGVVEDDAGEKQLSGVEARVKAGSTGWFANDCPLWTGGGVPMVDAPRPGVSNVVEFEPGRKILLPVGSIAGNRS